MDRSTAPLLTPCVVVQWHREQRFVREVVEQLVEVPKGRHQKGIQQRTAEQMVALPAPVLPVELERFSEGSEAIEVPQISRQESVEVDKTALQE